MVIRYPAPLRPGDRIGVTAPSSGVPAALRPWLDVAVAHLRSAGYDVTVGECMGDGDGIVSAPAPQRAAELTAMLTDPSIAAVVPPWGGELAVDLLPHLDLDLIGAAEATWMVGSSDISTLLLPLTLVTGTASLHAENLMDAPYRVPAPLASWLDVAAAAPGAAITQGATSHHRSSGFDDWAVDPTPTERTFDAPGSWALLDPGAGPVHARGRLAGWFQAATAVLVGRTSAPDSPGFSQRQAVASVLGDLDVPVVVDVDLGHVPPQLALVNGALADVRVSADAQQLTQHLR